MRLFTTKLHGILDCTMALMLLLSPRVYSFDTQLTHFMAILAIAIVFYSLLTHYEWGVFPIISTRVHLLFDCLIGIGLFFLPLFINASMTQSYLLISFGILLIFFALFTPSRSPREKKRRKKLHRVSTNPLNRRVTTQVAYIRKDSKCGNIE
jgi:hypothetical protein